jgi:hypothetical protein
MHKYFILIDDALCDNKEKMNNVAHFGIIEYWFMGNVGVKLLEECNEEDLYSFVITIKANNFGNDQYDV